MSTDEPQVPHSNKLRLLLHSFNNLLCTVLGNASLALEMVPPEGDAAASIRGVLQAAERATGLMQELRTVASGGPPATAPLGTQVFAPPASLLPASPAPAAVERRPEPSSSILVVDDEADSLRLLTIILRRRGYRVRPVRGGAAALRAAAAEPPGLVVLDIMMPGMDGYATCGRLKADARLRDIPVIFLSALGETPDKVRALAAGGVDYITKPFQNEEVYARIETHLRLRQYQLELEQANRELRRNQAELRTLTGKVLAKQDEERRARALQLHDDFSQQLVGLGLEAWDLSRKIRSKRGSPAPALEKFRDRIERLAREAYSISQEFHPAILDEQGLASTLEHECQALASHEGIEIRCECASVPQALGGQVALCFYRVFQESLTNTLRHARAKHVVVSLAKKSSGLLLSIRDDGAGFAIDTIGKKGGLGVASMEQRMRLIRGRLKVESRPGGGGTLVEAWAPLARARAVKRGT